MAAVVAVSDKKMNSVGGAALSIRGTGHYLPERIVTNDDLARVMNTSDDFIVCRTGVRTRRHADPVQALNDMIVPAVAAALDRAGMHAQDLDAIIVSTLSPDYHDPSQACLLQAAIGARQIPAFDIRAQCSGMLYGMELARGLMQSSRRSAVLLVCAEMLSKRLDVSNEGRNLAVLLGDGAAALVLGPARVAGRGMLDLRLGADGRYFDLLHTAAPGSKNRAFLDEEQVRQGRHHFRMNGAAMFEHACDTMVTAMREMLDVHQMSIADVDLLIPHQPNLRIIENVLERLGMPREKCVLTVEQLGNIASASLPIALSLAVERGQVEADQTLAFLAYGAGATWGVGLYRT
jgi:3-oxoacyl-[acyl-carrier-protein] synthase-3